MSALDTSRPWFARLQHDLVKRLLWAARDCRELERQPVAGELIATLYDDEGRRIDALLLWAQLCEEAPMGLHLDEFSVALRACVGAAQQNDLEGVLALETAFDRLRASICEAGTEFAQSLRPKVL